MEILKPHMLKPAPGSKRKPTRKGQGLGSGKGRTAGRGTKGTGQRNPRRIPPWFEGGNVPLYMRIPKRGGFTPPRRKEFTVVNVSQLERFFEPGEEVTPEAMIERGVIKEVEKDGVKILGGGEITKPLVVRAHAFSESAKRKIESAGGRAEVIER